MAMAMTPPTFVRTSITHHPHHLLLLRPISPPHLPKASDPNSNPDSTDDEDSFDSRLSQVRLRYRSGTGKKAELRKLKRGKQTSPGPSSGSGTSMFLPPVPLQEPISNGLKVEFGFSQYSERANGRLAGVGLLALLAVELATGKSMIKYHTPAIVFIQVYFMAAVSALYFKVDKEKVSVWPQGQVDAPSTK